MKISLLEYNIAATLTYVPIILFFLLSLLKAIKKNDWRVKIEPILLIIAVAFFVVFFVISLAGNEVLNEAEGRIEDIICFSPRGDYIRTYSIYICDANGKNIVYDTPPFLFLNKKYKKYIEELEVGDKIIISSNNLMNYINNITREEEDL